MIFDLLWYFKLWLRGIFIMCLAPFVFLFRLVFELPVLIAKKFENEKE